jgi:thiol-disulfide isomerase/thioredoxin
LLNEQFDADFVLYFQLIWLAMKAVVVSLLLLFFAPIILKAQMLIPGLWRAALIRQDGQNIVFSFDVRYERNQPVIRIHNATEKLDVRQIKIKKDSVFVEMPFFESTFNLQFQRDGSLTGNWVKGTSGYNVVMPFEAKPGLADRFFGGVVPKYDISGRWAMNFTSSKGESRQAVAEFVQRGSYLSGTVLTPTGDYRYLDGIVSGDSLFLSTFDGSHAYLFKGKIKDSSIISSGTYYSGASHMERFTAVKNPDAAIPPESMAIQLKAGEDKLDFKFPDLDGKMVSISDERFRNKVVVVQLMGSWCPNCMDETAYLSKFYKANKDRGVEMVSLAYEYSADIERSRKSLKKFQQRFEVTYPMLITGVTSSDSLRTEKTLPQITQIKSLPSTIFIGRDGKVKKIHGGFFGPATGEQYTQYVNSFESTINELLAQ